MRVISGQLGGLTFESPRGHRTHPMSDKIRNALFNALGDVGGLTVLDAFSGSGALSFEAISRGATHSTAVDIDKNAQKAIERNIQHLKVAEKITLIRSSISSWSTHSKGQLFDLIFCDPPYDNVQSTAIIKLVDHLRHKGIFVLSWPGGSQELEIPGLKVVSKKSYGDSQLIFYKQV